MSSEKGPFQSSEGKLPNDQVPSRCKSHIVTFEGSHSLQERGANTMVARTRFNLFRERKLFTGPPALTEGLPLALRRKLAVWAAAGGWLGIGRWPSAMPTMAVM